VALVQQGQDNVEVALVRGAHDVGGGPVAVRRDERHERAQGSSVQRRVDSVAVPGAPRRRQDALLLVVADGLRGEPVLAGEVDRPQTSVAHLVTPFEAFWTIGGS